MLLIRPLLQTNRERKHVRHTVIFFIFLVSNIGGCLLPIGDPPLFLGYLRGVPFLWTLSLWKEWAVLRRRSCWSIYWIWDSSSYQQGAAGGPPAGRDADRAAARRAARSTSSGCWAWCWPWR